nr:MAG TPA: ECF RNA polymerase sigma factor-anti-sigma complex, zinc binding motif.6A [Bacteriophage sp.]
METKMDKKQTSNEKRFYIPLELTPETVITEEYKGCEIRWSKIGCRKVRTILIPATKEQYYEFMRPLWREDKRQQRHGANEISADKAQDDYELEVPDDFNLEEEVVKEELLAELRHELAALQDIDRTILLMIADGSSEAAAGKAVGLSQKAVNVRKRKLYALLKEHLEDFR